MTLNSLPQRDAFAPTTPAARHADIEIISDLAGFRALSEDWNEFFQRAGQPQQVFQRFAFLDIWADHYLDAGAGLHIVVLRLDGRIQAIVPLVRSRRYGLDVLHFMGAPVAQFDDAIVDAALSARWIGVLWNAVAKSGADCLHARRVRADAALRRLLPSAARKVETFAAPFALLDRRVGEGGPGKAYSARERSNHRRRLRRLAEMGRVTAAALPSGDAAAGLAAEAIDIKRQWLQAEGLPSPTLSDPRFRAFFIDAAARPDSGMQVSAIELDGQAMAIDLSFDCKGGTFGHVLAAKPAFQRLGLGQLLIDHVFRMAKSRGSETFDLMAPSDEYKLKHADGVIEVDSLLVPFTTRGRIVAPLVFGHALPAARALAKRLPAKLVNRLAD
jgi:CelD/BcsL family acetyltransferase involved in cellulose biosynthesis